MTSFPSFSTVFRRFAPSIAVLAAALIAVSCANPRYAPNAVLPSPPSSPLHRGHLESVQYRSTVNGPAVRRMFVYLPENYYSVNDSYPVLYLLHGARGNELSWLLKGGLLDRIDSLRAAGNSSQFIVVLPNMNQYDDEKDYGNGRCKNAFQSLFKVDGSTESAFMRDVVSLVDSLYRTIPDREHRAIAGLSIGAMQSIHISATWPDSFGYVGAFSPMVHSLIMHSPYSGFYKGLDKKQVAQFSNQPELYSVMIGRTDIFYLPVRCYDRKLTRKGYSHELQLNPGGHEWYNWTDFCERFLQKIF